MCLCGPQNQFMFQLDPNSIAQHAEQLPALMNEREKIKEEQMKQDYEWTIHAKSLKAEIIFYNGTIYTMEDSYPIAQAVAVLKGRILKVGQEVQVFKRKDNKTKMVDLKRRTLLPGFVEPHIHMAFSAMNHYTDLSPFVHKNMEEVLQTIIKTVNAAKQGEWVPFQLFDPMITSGNIDVSLNGLDKISTSKAIFIYEANGHVGHVNSYALKLAGITKDTPDPPHGRMIHGSNGELTGQIQETANGLFTKKMPKIPGETYLNNFQKFISHASSKGCTTLHDCGIGLINPDTDLYVLHQVFKDPAPVRYSGYLVSTAWEQWMAKKIKPEWKDHNLRINGIKCWVDGSTQAGSAYLKDPYLKATWGVGTPNYSQKDLNEAVYEGHKKGFQVGIHANGDAGIDMALKAIEYANKKESKPELRHRIEHSTVCHKSQLAHMKQINVSPSFLIGHVYFYGGAFRDRVLGAERAYLVDPVKSAFEIGLTASLHSDYNCQPIDPLRCIHNAVTRIMKQNGQVLNSNECISPYNAMKMMTINSAWQCHMQDIVGSIRKGKFADFVILEEDPTKVPEKDIINIQIWQTWKGGEKWYQK